MIKETIKFNGSPDFVIRLNKKFTDHLCSVRLFDDVIGKNQTKIGKLEYFTRCETYLATTDHSLSDMDFGCQLLIENADIKYIIIFDEKVKIYYRGFRKKSDF